MAHKLSVSIVAFSLMGLVHPTASAFFVNNNRSCQDIAVIGSGDHLSHSIDCGDVSGAVDFPSCVTQADPVAPEIDSNNFLINTGLRYNSCLNAGDPQGQFEEPASILDNSSLLFGMNRRGRRIWRSGPLACVYLCGGFAFLLRGKRRRAAPQKK